MSDHDEILILLKAREAAIAAGDAQAILRPLAADVELYDLPPPLRYRGEAAHDVKAIQAWLDTWNGPVRSSVAEPTILVDGDLAVGYGLLRMQGDKKGEGPMDVWARTTVVLQRREGHWRIVHEHTSFPMRMDGSGKAALDLKP